MTSSEKKIPEMGQWPDKLVPAALIAGVVFSIAGLFMAFFIAPPVNGAGVNGA